MTMPEPTMPILEDLEPVPGGWIIRRNDEYVIDVMRQLFNWRLHVADADSYGTFYEHGYCYFGLGVESLVRAILAAQQWEDPLHTDPVGFDKKAF